MLSTTPAYQLGDRVLSMLLWSWGGTVYFLLEVIFKSVTGHPERISWTMLVVAILLTIPVERAGEQLPWAVPLWLQALVCAALVTAVELLAGCIINLWLGWDVWDYTAMPGNLWGQICPQYSALWFVLCLVFIPTFDWLRWAVKGGVRPRYTI